MKKEELMAKGLFMAEDALAFALYDLEAEKKTIPAPSKLSEVKYGKGNFVNYIACDTVEYARMHSNRAVKNINNSGMIE